jgi:predicted transcriptional regulator
MFYNMRMKTAKTICITLPPDLLKKAQKIAASEHRTMSELFREALRHYMAGSRVSAEPVRVAKDPEEGSSGVVHSFRMEKPPTGRQNI